MKVDPEYYNRSLLESDTGLGNNTNSNKNSSHRNGRGSMEQSRSGGMGHRAGMGGMHDNRPDLPDYLIRQHSLLGLYLSLNSGDEADAEANWGFPFNKRMAIAGVSVVVPLFLGLMLTGSWLWKVCVIGAVSVAAMLGMRFALHTMPNLEVTVQNYTLAVWPHGAVGILGFLGGIWLVVATVSGTGWSTVWLCVTSIVFLAGAEAALRAGMWHFRWWAPADRFAFLKPWGEGRSASRSAHQTPRESSYAPPRPMAAPPAPTPEQSEPFLGEAGEGRPAPRSAGNSFSERVELNRNLNGNIGNGNILGGDNDMGNDIMNSNIVDATTEEEEAAELLHELEGRGLGGGGNRGKVFDDEELQESV